jgi:cytochrome bd-type quinol oxidase subunit 1
MPGYRFEDILYGGLLVLVALVMIVVALVSLRRDDREAVRMSLSFTAILAVCALVLITGWVNILPLPH